MERSGRWGIAQLMPATQTWQSVTFSSGYPSLADALADPGVVKHPDLYRVWDREEGSPSIPVPDQFCSHSLALEV